MIAIRLSEPSMMIAEYIGKLWYRVAVKEGRRSRFGINEEKDGLDCCLQGACSEFVVSKAMNVFYDGNVGVVGPGDVGKLELRSTKYRGGHLVLHRQFEDGRPKDNPNAIYVLVYSYDKPTYYIAGWLYGHEGQDKKWWNQQPDRSRPCFWIPPSELKDPEELYKLFRKDDK